jgi:hypothetical protein
MKAMKAVLHGRESPGSKVWGWMQLLCHCHIAAISLHNVKAAQEGHLKIEGDQTS